MLIEYLGLFSSFVRFCKPFGSLKVLLMQRLSLTVLSLVWSPTASKWPLGDLKLDFPTFLQRLNVRVTFSPVFMEVCCVWLNPSFIERERVLEYLLHIRFDSWKIFSVSTVFFVGPEICTSTLLFVLHNLFLMILWLSIFLDDVSFAELCLFSSLCVFFLPLPLLILLCMFSTLAKLSKSFVCISPTSTSANSTWLSVNSSKMMASGSS